MAKKETSFHTGKNKENFKKIYETYAIKMFRVCYRYVNNEDIAAEILHDGFMKVYDNLGKFEERDEDSFEKWMRKIMVNESLMFLRKKKIYFMSLDDVGKDDLKNEDGNDTEMDLETIYEMILKLPDNCRTVFNMYVIEGYSHKEIGKKLNISESTSRVHLLKARSILQERIINHRNGI